MTAFAPPATSARTVAAPKPDAPPVTRATAPLSFMRGAYTSTSLRVADDAERAVDAEVAIDHVLVVLRLEHHELGLLAALLPVRLAVAAGDDLELAGLRRVDLAG